MQQNRTRNSTERVQIKPGLTDGKTEKASSRKRLKNSAHGIGGGLVLSGKNCARQTRAHARNEPKNHVHGIGGGLVLNGKNCAGQTIVKTTFPETTVNAVFLETH